MIIEIRKARETNEFVWYTCIVDQTIGYELNKKGRRAPITQCQRGVFQYNKFAADNDPAKLIFLADESAAIFLESPRILGACYQQMAICKKNNDYREEMTIISCGGY